MSEIAELIASLIGPHLPDVGLGRLGIRAADALRALAQDNEQMRAALSLLTDAATEIRELEAERDRLQAELRIAYQLPITMEHPVAQKLVAERGAIRAKAIEECAKICEPIAGEHFPPNWTAVDIERQCAVRRWCAAAIRALAQTDGGKTNVVASPNSNA